MTDQPQRVPAYMEVSEGYEVPTAHYQGLHAGRYGRCVQLRGAVWLVWQPTTGALGWVAVADAPAEESSPLGALVALRLADLAGARVPPEQAFRAVAAGFGADADAWEAVRVGDLLPG